MRLILIVTSFLLYLNSKAAEQEYYEPGIELPDDIGKTLILRACTGCHTLEGVPVFSKYWGYERWLPMVDNMVKHGAKLNEEEKAMVAKYLGKHYGTDGIGVIGDN